jgi:hypothetical protein
MFCVIPLISIYIYGPICRYEQLTSSRYVFIIFSCLSYKDIYQEHYQFRLLYIFCDP